MGALQPLPSWQDNKEEIVLQGKKEEPNNASKFSFDQIVLARENAAIVEKKKSTDVKKNSEVKKITDVQKLIKPKIPSLPEKKLQGNPKKEDVFITKPEAHMAITKSRSSSSDSSSWEYYTDTEPED